MNKEKLRRLLPIGAVAVLLPLALRAQLLGGWTITFDPTVAAKIFSETAEVIKVANIGMQTYNEVHMAAQFMRNKSFWTGFPFMIVNSYMASTGGPTDSWAKSVTRGLAVAQAYAMTSVQLRSNPGIIFQSPLSYRYITAQVSQSSVQAGMQTLGNVRVHQALMAAPIQNCQSRALSTADEDNYEASQLNITTACQSLALQQSQALVGVEAERLELELAAQKERTDALTDSVNQAIIASQYANQQPISPLGDGTTVQTYNPK